MIGLNGRNKPLYREITHIGNINECIVSPACVFRKAIVMNAAAIIVAHNHPSGDKTQSNEDKKVDETLRKAGTLLGIELLDSIIIGRST